MRHRVLLAGLVAALSACQGAKPPPTETFYDRKIGPILLESCANSPTQSGCHVAQDNKGNAFGNLNVTSYATLIKRTDLFQPYGPYGVPALLLKVLPPYQLRLSTWEQADPIIVTTDIPHAGGSLIDVTSTSYNEITRWIQRGAANNNALIPPKELPKMPCSSAIGDDPAFPQSDPTSSDYATFANNVSPMLGQKCAASNCHGSPGNILYMTCGDSAEQARWNYFVVSDYLSTDPQSSEILRRALDPNSGGVFHEGGTIFPSTSDSDYQTLLNWAKAKGGPPASTDVPFTFFARRVQPMLVKKGCMILGCHAPAMGHEYRIRGGSGGQFGLGTTRRNYALTLEQVALESPDPNTSRLLQKNLEPPIAETAVPQTPLGMLHRGGALFGRGDPCDSTKVDAEGGAVLDPENGAIDRLLPYCVIRHWIELERAAKMANVDPLSAVVYVKRTPAPGSDTPQDFGTFAPGADLMRTTASMDPKSYAITFGGAGTSLLGSCGLSPGIDVRRPAVSWDGRKIAFSARTSESEPLRIYVIDGATCAVEPTIDAPPDQNPQGELVHNFDPTFAPDGRIVFASTRGNVTNASSFDYQGPQRTPADPSKLNANLYVLDDTSIRQLTFLLNQELAPSFMSDGRLIMTTEKRAKDFYQLAGRRMNLDGGDYHPLFGQRATIGFHQVTDIVELADKNFAAIFSNKSAAHGGGALGVVNRSLGVDQESDDPKDYLQDPKAKDWPNPAFFQHSVRILDGVGTPGEGGAVYRSPTPLPNGKILVASAKVPDVGDFNGNFDLYVVDPISGERTGPVISGPDDEIWPVAVYGRYSYGVFKSKIDEPNGATRITDSDRSDVTILDLPLLTSLMFQNTRTRRVIPDVTDAEGWEDLPPEPGVKSYADGGNFVITDKFGQLYVRRRQIGSFDMTDDGSAHIDLPGGVPFVMAPLVQLAGDAQPTRHHQLEEMQFYPGEVVRQGFPHQLFNGVCGSCHGSTSGYEADIAANPDILTQASLVQAKDKDPTEMASRGGAKGPPFP